MKENKPILFINSATTNNFYQKNQYEYDSRRKIRNVQSELPKKEEEFIKNEQTEDVVLINHEEMMDEQDNNTFVDPYEVAEGDDQSQVDFSVTEVQTSEQLVQEESQVEEMVPSEKPFANKIRLLTRRAQLNRYVLVSIVKNEGEIEGLFKGSNHESITLGVNEENLTILIDEIVDIIIIRV